MNPLRSLRLRRATRDYVFKLGPWLQQAYGASRFYEPAQIERGVRELKLDPKLILFGYAVFLEPAAFATAIGAVEDPSVMEEAKAALRRRLRGEPQYDPMPDDLEQASELARVYRELAHQIESDGPGGEGSHGDGGGADD
jgi:hypothetical protein